MTNIYERIDENKQKSWLIMILFVLFTVLVIWLFQGVLGFNRGWLIMALVFSVASSIGSYFYSDRIILSLSKARPANRKTDFNFYTTTENLSMASQIPMPKLYVIDDTAPNAFATGRDPQHAVVCATTGLLDKLNRTELEGVVAHELSHIRNFDTRLMTIVTVLIGIIALLADWFMRSMWFGRDRDDRDNRGSGLMIIIAIAAAILSPLIGQLIQLAISRRREFYADAGSAMLTRQPGGLISALKKISEDREPLEVANRATAHLYIINPFKGRNQGNVGWFANLFNTHPSISDRIKALEQLV